MIENRKNLPNDKKLNILILIVIIKTFDYELNILLSKLK